MASSGSFNYYPVSEFGLYCEWSATPCPRANNTTVRLNVYLRHTSMVIEPRVGRVIIDGWVNVFNSPRIDTFVTTPENPNIWENTLIGTASAVVSHDPDGTKAVTLTAELDYAGEYNGQYFEQLTATTTVSLDPITVYLLSVSNDSHSTVTVIRETTGYERLERLVDGDTLYSENRIKVSFSADAGYQIVTHNVNGEPFASGGVIIVEDNVSVVATSQAVVHEQFSPDNIQCCDVNGVPLANLYQWDRDVELLVKNTAVSPPPTFQFANCRSNETIDVASTIAGNDLKVCVPNALLEQPLPLFAYVYASSGDGSARTLGMICVPVRKRTQPEDIQ